MGLGSWAKRAWRSAKKIAKGVFKKIGNFAKTIWHGAGGLFAIATNFIKNTVWTYVGMPWESLSVLVLRQWPPKKLRLRVTILGDENGNPVARQDHVEDAVALAQRVFKRELNVSIVGVGGQDIVRGTAEPSPPEVLNPPCSNDASDIHRQFDFILKKAGAWYRSRIARTPGGTFAGYGTPITMFVVPKIQGGKAGCAHLPWVENYGYIIPSALPPSQLHGDPDGGISYQDHEHSTLPHELGHCCGLLHKTSPDQVSNLMWPNDNRSGTKLSSGQKIRVRTCTHVTYL